MKQDIQDSIKKTNCYSISSYVTAVIVALNSDPNENKEIG